MRKLQVLLAVALVLVSGVAFAHHFQNDLSGTEWQGTITYQSDTLNSTPQTAVILLTFGTQTTTNNINFITGTIAGANSTTLPTGFPESFSAIVGPFPNVLLNISAPDTIMSANLEGRARTLVVRGSIVSEALAGTVFLGTLTKTTATTVK